MLSQGPVSDFNWSGQRLSHPLPSLKGQQSNTSGFTTGKLRGNVNSQENRKFICLLNFDNLELVNLFENLEFILPKKSLEKMPPLPSVKENRQKILPEKGQK